MKNLWINSQILRGNIKDFFYCIYISEGNPEVISGGIPVRFIESYNAEISDRITRFSGKIHKMFLRDFFLYEIFRTFPEKASGKFLEEILVGFYE